MWRRGDGRQTWQSNPDFDYVSPRKADQLKVKVNFEIYIAHGKILQICASLFIHRSTNTGTLLLDLSLRRVDPHCRLLKAGNVHYYGKHAVFTIRTVEL